MSIRALNWAFAQDIKNSNHKFVLVALADIADDYGICWPSYNTIAKKCSIGRSTAIRAVKELQENGIISKTARYKSTGQNSNAFRLNLGVKIEEDHPLKDLVSERHPPVSERHPPVSERHPPSVTVTPKPTNEPLKEKKALTREQFMRSIDQGYQDNEFEKWDYLTESEIKCAAEDCLDFYGAKNEWPAGNPVYVLRHWIRGGVKNGSIRKKPIENANQGEKNAEPLEDWQEQAFKYLPKQVVLSWVTKLSYDGQSTIKAPSQFHADHVRANFYHELEKITSSGVEITH